MLWTPFLILLILQLLGLMISHTMSTFIVTPKLSSEREGVQRGPLAAMRPPGCRAGISVAL